MPPNNVTRDAIETVTKAIEDSGRSYIRAKDLSVGIPCQYVGHTLRYMCEETDRLEPYRTDSRGPNIYRVPK